MRYPLGAMPENLLRADYDQTKILVMILAGGEGRRLGPLTYERAKPAVPFGGRYRIIDIVLSNFVNSGLHRIKVLTQYKSSSLDEHIARGPDLLKITQDEHGWGTRPMIRYLPAGLLEEIVRYYHEHRIRTTIHVSNEIRGANAAQASSLGLERACSSRAARTCSRNSSSVPGECRPEPMIR